MAHSHWDSKRFPELTATRICQLPKKECDALWTAYLHRHEGHACVKRVEPGNKIATCILRPNAAKRGAK